jgi:hypothetical protein
MIDDLYVKMCETAVKVQELWEPIAMNIMYCTGLQSVGFLKRYSCHYKEGYKLELQNIQHFSETIIANRSDCVWLPTQSQLQGMVDIHPLSRLVQQFSVFAHNNLSAAPTMDSYNIRFETMNQLWLAFVMHKKFNKTWNGEGWENVQP